MSHFKTIAVSLGVGALCLCAFAVSSASALTLHECKAKGSGGTGSFYSDANCVNPEAGGKFERVPIGEAAQKISTTNTSNFTIGTTINLATFNIICTVVTSSGETAANGLVGGEMFVSGEAVTEFSTCNVEKGPEGCNVTVVKTEKLKYKTTPANLIKYEPVAGTLFAKIKVEGCKNGALNGEKELKGTATSETLTPQTQKFTTESGTNLTFAGAGATLTGEYHVSTEGKTEVLSFE